MPQLCKRKSRDRSEKSVWFRQADLHTYVKKSGRMHSSIRDLVFIFLYCTLEEYSALEPPCFHSSVLYRWRVQYCTVVIWLDACTRVQAYHNSTFKLSSHVTTVQYKLDYYSTSCSADYRAWRNSGHEVMPRISLQGAINTADTLIFVIQASAIVHCAPVIN